MWSRHAVGFEESANESVEVTSCVAHEKPVFAKLGAPHGHASVGAREHVGLSSKDNESHVVGYYGAIRGGSCSRLRRGAGLIYLLIKLKQYADVKFSVVNSRAH